MKLRCPHCGHIQNTKSKLKKVTCSSCQKKFIPKDNINSSEPIKEDPTISKELEKVDKEFKKEEQAFEKEVKKLKLD